MAEAGVAKGLQGPLVFVPRLDVDAGGGEATQGPARAGAVTLDAAVAEDGLGALGEDDLEELVGYLVQGLVPGQALPFALPSLARPLVGMLDAGRVVHAVGEGHPLVAPPGVEVGATGVVGGRVVGSLFLPEDHPLPDEGVEGAYPVEGAVNGVGDLHYPIPGDGAAAHLPQVEPRYRGQALGGLQVGQLQG